MDIHARYFKSLSRFNLIGQEKNWQVQLLTSSGNVSALFDEEEEPDLENLLPSDVLDLIEARTNAVWSSNKADRLAKIAELRQQIEKLDVAWLAVELERADKVAAAARRRYDMHVQAATA